MNNINYKPYTETPIMSYQDNMHSVDPCVFGCEKSHCTNKAKLPMDYVLKCYNKIRKAWKFIIKRHK